MKTVKFTEMKSGTKDEYLLLDKYEQEYINGTADRILDFMKGLNSTLEGYKISRLEHSLQTATRAFNDKAEEEMFIFAREQADNEKDDKVREDKFKAKTSCDTELLAWLLDNYSYEEVICDFIDSMHAFVIFNKYTNEINLSRDHAGITPLYFSNVKS